MTDDLFQDEVVRRHRSSIAPRAKFLNKAARHPVNLRNYEAFALMRRDVAAHSQRGQLRRAPDRAARDCSVLTRTTWHRRHQWIRLAFDEQTSEMSSELMECLPESRSRQRLEEFEARFFMNGPKAVGPRSAAVKVEAFAA